MGIHQISLDEAKKMIERHRSKISKPRMGEYGGRFNKDEVLELLNQKECLYMRYYHGENENGEPVIILIGVDKNDKDMENGKILEESNPPCPPNCPPGALNS